VLDESVLSPASETAVRDAFLRKDWVGLRRTVSQVSEGGRESILALTEMRGGPETVAKARRLVSGQAGQAALDNLQAVVDILTEFGVSHQVQVDLGLVKDLSYYTGMVLEGYAPNLGYTLCTGGRYDQLHTQFGQDNPATGFALGLTRLTTALGETAAELVAEERRMSVSADTGCRREALAAVQSLQGRGVAVEWELPEPFPAGVASQGRRNGSCQAFLKFFRRDGDVWFRFERPDADVNLESPISEFSRVTAALGA
jgi:ATP phosphoribosyltransferase regulatory subunit